MTKNQANQRMNRFGRPRALHMVTAPISAQWLMRGQLRFLKEAGFDVTLVASPGKGLEEVGAREGIETIGVPMSREIAPWQDLISLWRLCKIIRHLQPDITNVGTPKASLLGGIAAWLNRVPCRIYTLRGLRHETTRGLKRGVLWLSEWIACQCADRVICVSESLRRKALATGIGGAEKLQVLGSGSSNGVDASRFAPSTAQAGRLELLRSELEISHGAKVLGFVGRLTRDKGIVELLEAYESLRHSFPALQLLLVGEFEEGDPIPPHARSKILTDPGIRRTGFVEDIELYYHVMDVVALPTYREGFPNSVLEAQAAGKPVVGTIATGVVDAIEDGVTGLLVPVGDSQALAGAIARVLNCPELAAGLGRAGQVRVLREFRQEDVWEHLALTYSSLLEEKGLPLPRPAIQTTFASMARVADKAQS